MPGEGGSDLELPILLPPQGIALLELTPRRSPSLEISLAAPRYVWRSGETFDLDVILRNVSETAQRGDITLTGSLAGFVPASPARADVGTIPPGASRALRFRLRVPPVGRSTEAFLSVQARTDSRATLAIQVQTSLSATLETPRVDLDVPGHAGPARVRLTDQGSAPMTVRLYAEGAKSASRQSVRLPGGGRSIVREIEVAAPSRDAGLYPVNIAVDGSGGGRLATVPVLVGVPLFCHYAPNPPKIDGSLEEWTNTEPIGMGRREQVHDKQWRGPADLSAYAYVQWDEQNFYFACAVTDDVVVQNFPPAELWRGDSVVFALSTDRSAPPDRTGYSPADHEFGLALRNGAEPILYRFAGPPGTTPGVMTKGVVAVRRSGSRTFYEAAIPWSELGFARPKPGAMYGFSVLINDNDGEGRGYIAWSDGLDDVKRPGLFPPMRLVRP
jgi:hypothetical protein